LFAVDCDPFADVSILFAVDCDSFADDSISFAVDCDPFADVSISFADVSILGVADGIYPVEDGNLSLENI
jgi:hypothetical protein